MHVYKKIQYLTFSHGLEVKVTQNVTLHLRSLELRRVTSNVLVDAFTRKDIIRPSSMTLGSMSHETLYSTRYIM